MPSRDGVDGVEAVSRNMRRSAFVSTQSPHMTQSLAIEENVKRPTKKASVD